MAMLRSRRVRVLLSTFGTAGDVIPFARLARALVARDHAVTVHSWPHYRRWFPETIRFVAAGGGVTEDELDRTMDWALRAPSPFDQIRRFADLFYGRARDDYETARASCSGQDVALINMLDHVAQAAADRAGLPWLCYTSRPLPPEPQADAVFADVDAAVGALLAEVTGAPRRLRVWREASPVRTLVVCSPRLIAPPAADKVELTGGWLEPAQPEPLPLALEDFLARGPALLVTFGTMPDVTGRTAALVAAAAQTGWRALVQVLPPALPPDDVPAGIHVVTARLPFAALLPRVAAVVHHGSVGTAHEVVRAGRPALVVPHMGDQFFWADALHARGLGPAPIAFTALAPAPLRERFAALRDPAIARRAEALAPAVAAEDGVAAAVRALEAAR